MPKAYITKQQKLNNELCRWLIGEMGVRRMTQRNLAEELGISQQDLSYKIKTCSFKYEDLVGIFRILKPDADKLAQIMGVK